MEKLETTSEREKELIWLEIKTCFLVAINAALALEEKLGTGFYMKKANSWKETMELMEIDYLKD